MKKILVALALAAFASASYAAVAGSAHDFNAGSYANGKSSSCAYCHVPHAAKTWANVALWATNAASTATDFTLYSNNKYKATALDIKGSQTCLACHADGQTATTGLGAAVETTSPLNVGYDLRNDHPIGTGVNLTPGTSAFKAPIYMGYQTYTSGGTYEMKCATCHNPHNSRTIAGSKLLYADQSGATTDFCMICHTR